MERIDPKLDLAKGTAMLLELGKAVSFLLSMLSLYAVAINAFFLPGTRWEERLWLALAKVIIAACVCFASGLLFCFPARSNPDANQALLSTLPVKLFFWAITGMVLFFAAFWYLRCGGPCCWNVNHDCV